MTWTSLQWFLFAKAIGLLAGEPVGYAVKRWGVLPTGFTGDLRPLAIVVNIVMALMYQKFVLEQWTCTYLAFGVVPFAMECLEKGKAGFFIFVSLYSAWNIHFTHAIGFPLAAAVASNVVPVYFAAFRDNFIDVWLLGRACACCALISMAETMLHA